MEPEWHETNRIAAVAPHQPSLQLPGPIVAFDTNAELLWIGNEQGYITSYHGLELRKYTSYRGHMGITSVDKAVRQIQFNDRGLVSVAAKSLHFATRGGITQWNLLDDRFKALSTMAYTSRGTSEVLVGGGQNSMFTVNLEKGTVGTEIRTDQEVKVIKRSSRHIVLGMANGDCRLLDMNTFQVVKEFQGVHNGMILDMDTHDNLMITCGYALRHGGYMIDPLVKIYDLRMQKALPPHSFPGAAFIRMHPKMTAAAIIASNNGQFENADVMNPSSIQLYHANIQTYLTAMDLSPTGDVLAMMDGEGILQLWTRSGKSNFTDLAAPIEWPEPVPQITTRILDDTPLNTIGMPYYREELLSNWPQHLTFNLPKLPQKIDPDILAASSVTGYAPNHRRLPRNYVEPIRKHDDTGVVPVPKFLSQQGRDRDSKTAEQIAEDRVMYGDDSKRQFQAPPMYRKQVIKYSRFGVDDFDFSYYNNTTFSGLETNIPNSYMNPLLQLYRFTPRLRNVALSHAARYCTKEDCMLCQLGFLIDMLEKANGQNCQASNFLNTLRCVPAAARHGVLEDEGGNAASLNAMMQALNRFLLDLMINEQKAQPSEELELPDVLMIKATKSQRCMVCHKETRPSGDTVTSDLIYSAKPPGGKPLMSFAGTIRQSIQVESSHKGWCDKCRRYQHQGAKKTISQLPDVLTFNVTTHDKNMSLAREHWSSIGWFPDHIGMAITGSKHQLTVLQGEDLKQAQARNTNNPPEVYELIGFVLEIREEEKKHMVSIINVSPTDGSGDGKPNWHMFNDFLVRPIPASEALDFTPKWKMPSVLVFQRKHPSCAPSDVWRSYLDPWIIYNDYPYLPDTPFRRESTCTPLDPSNPHEKPHPGMLVAIDAEFVSMRKEITEIHADGTKSIIRPSRLGLARVSVLRGEGELEGTPFLDDYIATKEPIIDYLTAYSGIYPGDLDPVESQRALVSLKVAYKRLWILLNMGCVFIGHGLLKDFRIINIHVPKNQVLDTVHLFAPRITQRKFSLRFLAWAILNEQVQTSAHDSIEDARTALRLYRKFLEYSDAGIMETMLDRIYHMGVKHAFKAPEMAVVEEGGEVVVGEEGRVKGL